MSSISNPSFLLSYRHDGEKGLIEMTPLEFKNRHDSMYQALRTIHLAAITGKMDVPEPISLTMRDVSVEAARLLTDDAQDIFDVRVWASLPYGAASALEALSRLIAKRAAAKRRRIFESKRLADVSIKEASDAAWLAYWEMWGSEHDVVFRHFGS